MTVHAPGKIRTRSQSKKTKYAYENEPSTVSLITAASCTNIKKLSAEGAIIHLDREGELESSEYPMSHKLYGQIRKYVKGVCTRLEFATGHSDHGEIIEGCLQSNQYPLTVTFIKSHHRHGEIETVVNNEVTKLEFDDKHYNHGKVFHFVNGEVHVLTFDRKNSRHGEIQHFISNRWEMTTFIRGHPRYGEILRCHLCAIGDNNICIDFIQEHPRFG
tara:strand:+ start:1205 stop:1855 length:651 start_codon:yes stop_codon:yes gene_type:complete